MVHLTTYMLAIVHLRLYRAMFGTDMVCLNVGSIV